MLIHNSRFASRKGAMRGSLEHLTSPLFIGIGQLELAGLAADEKPLEDRLHDLFDIDLVPDPGVELGARERDEADGVAVEHSPRRSAVAVAQIGEARRGHSFLYDAGVRRFSTRTDFG
jgi:hypothetical protein